MATVSSHVPGVPSWIDLATPDVDAAKAFYGELFGWSFDDRATDTDGVHYTMCNKGDKAAAGIMALSEQMAAAGMPPAWSTYVTVTDVEASLAKVEAAGGTVLQPAMEVMEDGRMAVVADPSGAVIAMWQPKAHIGAEVVNEHGALTWNELTTPDPAAVAGFYNAVFGWTTETAPMPEGEYTLFLVDGGNEQGIAGAMAPPMEMPNFWGIYIHSDDAAATAARAKERGAGVLMEATAMEGVGTLATLTDPQGAMFSVMTPES
ncbi:MAG: VOC family protein [Microthrixaceae bacterium]